MWNGLLLAEEVITECLPCHPMVPELGAFPWEVHLTETTYSECNSV